MNHRTTSHAWTLIALLMLPIACAEGADEPQGPEKAPVEVKQQFITWAPNSTLDQQHVDWHTRRCSQAGQPPTGQVGVGRRCARRGEDFLVWHRNFVDRLRDDYEAQGLTADITPWYTLPSEMKSSANGWTASLQTAENNIRRLVNGSGQRFATLDEFGLYLENFYHNSLHGIAQRAYGESVVGGAMSPRSTYFFKIHGLVEYHLQRFLQGDFNWDGRSDLVIRDRSTGANRIAFLNDGAATSSQSIRSADVDGCGWYLGGTGDFNYDGWLDLVWHGPGCTAVHVWLMNGTSYVSTEVLTGVGADWNLVGVGDFSNDLRPDLVWSSATTKDLSIWVMNGTQLVRGINFDVPGTWEAVMVAHVAGFSIPNLLLRRFVNGVGWEWAYERTLPGGQTAGTAPIIGMTTDGAQDLPAAAGRYQNEGVPADFVFFRSLPPPGTSGWFVSRRDWNATSTTYTSSALVPLAGNEHVAGPR